MPRQIFLSFMGTSNYVPCNYHLEFDSNSKIENVRFVQEALIKLNCNHFTNDDKIIIFCTEKSYSQNYLNDGHFDFKSKTPICIEGLQTRLQKLDNKIPFEEIRIKEGFSEAEIWEIFETISDSLQADDEIYFDITHAFRFLPMMGLVLINYLKATKNISLKAIHYGAFEKLGTASEIIHWDIKDRNVPILNLTALIELNQWTEAVHNFNKYGIVDDMFNLANQNIRLLLKESQGIDQVSRELQYLVKHLLKLSQNIQTNRGLEILNFDYAKLNTIIESLSTSDVPIKPLKGVLKLIDIKIKPLVNTNLIWLESAKWCIQHNLFQQGITQLQEGIVTQIIINYSFLSPAFLVPNNEKARTLISSILNVIKNKTLQSEWNNTLTTNSDITNKLFEIELINNIAELYANISALRNDINHGGYTKTAPPITFINMLKNFIGLTETHFNKKH